MRKLPKPSFDINDIITDCVSNMREGKDKYLTAIPVIDTYSTQYDESMFQGAAHELAIHDMVTDDLSKDDMVSLYTNKFAKKDQPGRKYYDKIKLAPPNSICPLCGIGQVTTLDHYMAKTLYPSLAVTPHNLIPACRDCNDPRGAVHFESAGDMTLHPYYDEVQNLEFAPDVAMWATTFGKASTGKAISELSGIARTNAQLAILGGGAKRIGGKGIAGGKAFLAIVGPLTEVGIICLSGAANVWVRCRENYRRAMQADTEAHNIRQATTVLINSTKHIIDLIKQTDELLLECNTQLNDIHVFKTENDSSNSIDNVKKLEQLISNCSKLSVLINQTI